MAIEARVADFIRSIQGRVAFCHHATATILCYAKFGKKVTEMGSVAAALGATLDIGRGALDQYDPRKAVPPNLYDVFGFFAKKDEMGNLVHSAIVVDVDPEIILAECDNLKMQVSLNAFSVTMEHMRTRLVYLFPSEFFGGFSSINDSEY